MNDRQKKFADLIIMGRPASRAYKEAGYSATGNGAEVNGHKLLKNPEIKAYIEAAKERAAEAAEIERAECVKFLADVIRTPIGQIDENHPLCQEVTYNVDGSRKVKMPAKLGAIQELAKFMGWNQPEKVEVEAGDTLRDLLIEIRARNGESEIA